MLYKYNKMLVKIPTGRISELSARLLIGPQQYVVIATAINDVVINSH